MGVSGAGFRSLGDLSSQVPGYLKSDFRYFMDHVYSGDHDDFAEVVMKKFYKWVDSGAIKRPQTAKAKFRLFVDVPFPKKDEFKRDFGGLWNPEFKCWFVLVPDDASHLRNRMIEKGFKPILILSDKTDHVHVVYDAGLAKSKFNSLHAGHNSVGSTDKVYTG